MKLTNYLSSFVAVFFVMGVLSSTYAGQKEVVVSPDPGESKAEPSKSEVVPKKVVPEKTHQKVVPAPGKKLEVGKESQEPTLPMKCNGKVVTIIGTSGVDFLNGTPGPDVIHGLGGDDIIRGMGGNDTICGGDGNDRLDGGDGNDILDGGKGNDVCINGPSGAGILVAPKNCENQKDAVTEGTKKGPVKLGRRSGFVPKSEAEKVPFVGPTKMEPSQPKSGGTEIVPKGKPGQAGTGGFVPLKVEKKREIEITVKCNGLTPTIFGTSGDDWILAGPSDDVIHGLGGNDKINGHGGDDTICGGDGNDEIQGYTGNDNLFGGDGDDNLDGGDGDDNMWGQGGNDILKGHKGNDHLIGGSGDDDLEGGPGNDELYGEEGDDSLYGCNAYNDCSGNDKLYGGDGNDVLYGGGGPLGVYGLKGKTTTSNELYGNDGDDRLYANLGSKLDGGPGKDRCIQTNNSNGISLGLAPINCESDLPTMLPFEIKVDVEPHGTYAKFFVTTTRWAILKLRVFQSQSTPNPFQECSENLQAPMKSIFALGWKMHWDADITGLTPNFPHYWVVCAKDKGGNEFKQSGTFRTLKRRVKVTFTKVDIVDDSDDLSDGECLFGFFLNPDVGTYGERSTYYPSPWGRVVCETGKPVIFGKNVTLGLVNAGLSLTINATGYDNDGSGCGSAPIPPLEGYLINSCGDSSGQSLTFILEPPGLLDENISKTFQIQALYPNGRLALIFHGSLFVDYIKTQ